MDVQLAFYENEDAKKKNAESKATLRSTKKYKPSIGKYTTSEKAWLKVAFGGEFKFLRMFGLSIYDEEDREEGRSIARGFVAQDAGEEEEEDVFKGEEEDEENQFLADIEADPMSHIADYQFNEQQLECIQRHRRHSRNFLETYGLKPWENGDCKEGAAIAQAFMEDGDDDEPN